ncbi:transposase [Cytophagaceae bacterium NT2B1]|nr:transposase [Xanthocytophaga flavus]
MRTYIVANLSVGTRGKECSIELLTQIVEAILYRLKTGCQSEPRRWRFLPVSQFVREKKLSWQGVYYHFTKWVKDGSWTKVWLNLLSTHKDKIDLSCVQLDGSHTICKRAGEAVGYQTRKKAPTTNTLFLADRQGQLLACSTCQAGNHHDLFDIENQFEQLCSILTQAGIEHKGLFLNADAGFDSEAFRKQCQRKEIQANIAPNTRNTTPTSPLEKQKHNQQWTDKEDHNANYHYFDELLYSYRTVIEQANAWMDSFKVLLIRFEKKAPNWTAFLYMAFSIRFLRKIQPLNKY